MDKPLQTSSRASKHGLSKKIEKNKLHKRLRRETGRAVDDFSMIDGGDRIMVCISGGKDSLTMLDILLSLQAHAPIQFELVAVNLDQKQPGFPEDVLPGYFESLGVEYTILEEDTYSLVTDMVPEGKTYCGWCSRFRRGILYTHAKQHGFTKIALGHHRDDIIETLFLNLFHGGKLKTMPPKLLSDDGENVVIRPLAYCSEADIERYSKITNMPVIPCNLCGSQDNLQRPMIKEMLKTWNKQQPGRLENIFRAMSNVVPSHLLDTNLYDFGDTKTVEKLNVVNLQP
ncbi:MAG: tRNA 2-thiocytidine(32) synthetase TtcA [Pseudomonadales bacterium]|jgi:tRNA 2-thiocytidine biosynthesis protein TtcA|nr:tRNA 2-thiocytidine(32) synthetase TtcA [Gammaproteobacteria bacterium]MDP6026565.1 tRNA 2-thiocytidine(32) synthetase TtcA [Pseudomonadales bacterium]MDP6317133.1 tRNA 2-thiocytidine(32) synthetase TtcA [Pseudomonadales bacterium]MDP7314886.1 tRNA 2-thiocytidine(32) synthetase TtcA [Pseudomonadales bacterium]MDP7576969.1 tRNA 2-thiocytidine(32) synthetase TtcA [Pseudomonadales bacterium]